MNVLIDGLCFKLKQIPVALPCDGIVIDSSHMHDIAGYLIRNAKHIYRFLDLAGHICEKIGTITPKEIYHGIILLHKHTLVNDVSRAFGQGKPVISVWNIDYNILLFTMTSNIVDGTEHLSLVLLKPINITGIKLREFIQSGCPNLQYIPRVMLRYYYLGIICPLEEFGDFIKMIKLDIDSDITMPVYHIKIPGIPSSASCITPVVSCNDVFYHFDKLQHASLTDARTILNIPNKIIMLNHTYQIYSGCDGSWPPILVLYENGYYYYIAKNDE